MVAPGSGATFLAADPAKRWTEVLWLTYSLFWITWVLIILVPFQLYEHMGRVGYMFVGLATACPVVLLSYFLPSPADKGRPWSSRYWVKANVWIAIFSYVGNYFWTHYFYKVLGAAYSFPSWRLNDVPITLFFMTHAYFCFYHALSNVLLRRVRTGLKRSHWLLRRTAMTLVVFGLAYATAYGETLTISAFPYYHFKDHARMYTVGSLFYAIYFFVSFPMFFLMDEDPGTKKRWTLGQAATDSLAASMLVTIFLDLWRISIGGIAGHGKSGSNSLPWL